MKSIDEAKAQARLDEILEEAQRQPIVITRQGRHMAVVVSIASYESLRRENIEAFLQVRRDLAAEAAGNGLNEDELPRLLRDDV